MAGSLLARARFMAGLLLRVASRALPARSAPAPQTDSGEAVIEAIMTGDIAALDGHGSGLAKGADAQGNPWFFIALDVGSLSAVEWFLRNGADPNGADRGGRLALECVIERAALADEFDDHAGDVPAMARALIAAGATPTARTITGARLADLADAAGIALS